MHFHGSMRSGLFKWPVLWRTALEQLRKSLQWEDILMAQVVEHLTKWLRGL